ncbi:MAG TPA: carboxypeptidase-like regulatory domain-containing protein, partial [Archangium sp.]
MRGGLGVALAVMLAACEPAEAPAPVVPTRAVTVKVVDPRGADLMEAELSLDDAPFLRRPDGGFRLEGVSEGKPHRLRARSEGHLDQALTLPFGSTVTVVLEPFARLTGRVVGSDGGLVPAFTLRTGARTTSSTDGGFALELKPGAWTLEVEAPSFAKTRVETTAPGDVLIGLEPGATFVGRVRELDGTPFKRARVSVSADQGTTTDDEGRFELGGLRAGTYQVHVEAPRGDLPPWLAMMERSVRAGERLELDFREAEGALLSGTVVNQRGQPV